MNSKGKYHYNYVYFNTNYGKGIDPNEYNAICTRDLETLDNVIVVQVPLQKSPKILRLLFNIHNSARLNEIFDLPFKKLWFPYYFKDNFKDTCPYCFIFASSNYSFEYMDYLRKKYPNCKIVMVCRDLLKIVQRNPQYTDENMNKVFDLRLSYDLNESKIFNMIYFDEIESKIDVAIDPNYPLCDVFFAGKAKDRLPKLIEAYDLFTSFGLKCNFFITHVDKDKQIPRKGITYSDKLMPYKEMLYKSVNAKFMFDINQTGAVGYTSRFLEAVMYNKRFITDNIAVKSTEYYKTGDILLYENISDIDRSFFHKSEANYQYKGDFSPIHLLEKIDAELAKGE